MNEAGRGGGGGSFEVNVYLPGGVRTKVKVNVVGVRAGVRVLTQWYVVVVVMPVFRYVVIILVAFWPLDAGGWCYRGVFIASTKTRTRSRSLIGGLLWSGCVERGEGRRQRYISIRRRR